MSAETALTNELLEALRSLIGDRVSTSLAVREQHGKDVSYHEGSPPDAVAFAESTEEVAQIVRLCAEHKTPIVPFGTGTSLEGHIAALKGGICIDLSRMNEILEINAEELDCRVQAGVTRKQLNEYLRDTGLFFPIDPGADASLGGMASTRQRYQRRTLRNDARKRTWIDGGYGRWTHIRTGARPQVGGGHDLTALRRFKGTLGIITEVQLRLHGVQAISAAVCAFDSLRVPSTPLSDDPVRHSSRSYRVAG